MDDGGIFTGYLLGRFENQITRFLSKINRRTGGALVFGFFGLAIGIIAGFFIRGEARLLFDGGIGLVLGVAFAWLILLITHIQRDRKNNRLRPRLKSSNKK